MRKNIYLFAVMSMVFTFSSCTYEKSALQEATGASSKQTKYLENKLEQINITYETVAVSSNPIVDGMDINWLAYDLIANDGTSHVLILRKSDNDFTAVLDSDGRNLDGVIDNGVTPALFKNGEYIFSEGNS